MWNLRQELPPQRRDASARHRRIRKVGRIVRKRLIIALLLFAALSSFFGWKALRDRGSGNKSRSNIGFSAVPSIIHAGLHFRNHDNDSGVWVYPGTSRIKENRQYGPDVAKHLYTGHRRRHGPCDIDFVKSVDHFIEPDVYMNFTRFSLGYIDEEKKYDGESSFYGRFAGHQTLDERENSFYVRSQTIHCGFVRQSKKSAGTGFDLADKDYEYMNACKVVVSSCIFGGFDFLRRPTRSKISEYSKKNVCFVMFLDQISMTKLYSDGQIPDNSGYIGLWRIVEVRNLPYMDMRKSGKVPKFLSHRLFPSARYSIWIDSKLRLNADPMLILEYFLWRKKSEYAISNHYDRHCVWEEVLQNKRLNKYNHSAIDEQFNFYQSDGLTKFNESGMSDLPSYVPEGSFIIRAHTPMSNLFSCLWFNEVDLFTSRDQLSFAYTFLKLRRMNPERPFFFNMFKDCERRALAKLFRHRNEYPHPPPDV